MNYIIEDDLDFKDELNKLLNEDDNNDDKCLITNLRLEKPYVELICGHKFNYTAILNEVSSQKNNFYEKKKLNYKQIRCPYCRNIQNNLLPQLKDYPLITGVNSPYKFCMFLNKCCYRNKNNALCNVGTNEQYCKKHVNIINKVKSRCVCKTASGERCKNGGMKYLLNDNEHVLCKIHFNKYNKSCDEDKKLLLKYT